MKCTNSLAVHFVHVHLALLEIHRNDTCSSRLVAISTVLHSCTLINLVHIAKSEDSKSALFENNHPHGRTDRLKFLLVIIKGGRVPGSTLPLVQRGHRRRRLAST